MRKPVPVGMSVVSAFLLSIVAAPLAGQTRGGAEAEPPVAPLSFDFSAAPAEKPQGWNRGDVLMPGDPLLVKMGELQERSQQRYKTMTFEQKAVIERYKPTSRLGVPDKVGQHRELVARYSPNGNGELSVELVADSDKKAWQKHLKAKESGKPRDQKSESLAKQLIEPILFPMTSENVQHCKFTVLLATPEVLLLRFEPIGAHHDPIFEGQVFVNGDTGAIYRLEIDHLWNFEKINGKFKYLKDFYAAVDYFEQPGGDRFPTRMTGRGYAKVLFVKGNFRFEVTESGYASASSREDSARNQSPPAYAAAARALDEPPRLEVPTR